MVFRNLSFSLRLIQCVQDFSKNFILDGQKDFSRVPQFIKTRALDIYYDPSERGYNSSYKGTSDEETGKIIYLERFQSLDSDKECSRNNH